MLLCVLADASMVFSTKECCFQDNRFRIIDKERNNPCVVTYRDDNEPSLDVPLSGIVTGVTVLAVTKMIYSTLPPVLSIIGFQWRSSQFGLVGRPSCHPFYIPLQLFVHIVIPSYRETRSRRLLWGGP